MCSGVGWILARSMSAVMPIEACTGHTDQRASSPSRPAHFRPVVAVSAVELAELACGLDCERFSDPLKLEHGRGLAVRDAFDFDAHLAVCNVFAA